jgi:hypothetical protein
MVRHYVAALTHGESESQAPRRSQSTEERANQDRLTSESIGQDTFANECPWTASRIMRQTESTSKEFVIDCRSGYNMYRADI